MDCMIRNVVVAKTRRLGGRLWRIVRGFNKAMLHMCLPRFVKLSGVGSDLERLGTDYGGWTVPVDYLGADSVCYCVGVGVDASFDFALSHRCNCRVYSFDPTPKAIRYMQTAEYDRDKITFMPIGIWDEDTTIRFYAPADSRETSHSVYDLHGTGQYFEAECHKLATVMAQFDHTKIDLLKLDIEGAWRRVVNNIVSENIAVDILCVELDSPVSLGKVLSVIRTLGSAGFALVHFEKDNYLFVQKSLLQRPPADEKTTRKD